MASTKNLLPLALIGGAALLAFRAVNNTVQTVGRLSVSNAKVKKIKFTGLKFEVELEVVVNNPGSVDIPFEYYTGSITHAGTKISDFTFNGQGKNVILKARNVTPVTFNLSIGAVSLVMKLVQLVNDITQGKKVDTIFKISSNLYAAGIDIPVNFTHDIKPGVISGINGILSDRIKAKLAQRRATRFAIKNKLFPAAHPLSAIIPTSSPTPALQIVQPPVDDNSYQGWAGNGPLSGIGSTKQKNAGKFFTTWDSVNKVYNVFFSPSGSTKKKSWINIGYTMHKPSRNDISLMYDQAKKNKVPGIGKPTARLEFSSNEELSKHFGCNDRPKIFFSKN